MIISTAAETTTLAGEAIVLAAETIVSAAETAVSAAESSKTTISAPEGLRDNTLNTGYKLSTLPTVRYNLSHTDLRINVPGAKFDSEGESFEDRLPPAPAKLCKNIQKSVVRSKISEVFLRRRA